VEKFGDGEVGGKSKRVKKTGLKTSLERWSVWKGKLKFSRRKMDAKVLAT
jgi:hypothetical protein